MNLINIADANLKQLCKIMETAEHESSDSYLFENDVERTKFIDNREQNYNELNGKQHVLNIIAQALLEIQNYVDIMLIQGYEKLRISQNNAYWYLDEDSELCESSGVNRVNNNIEFEFNSVEDSIKIYYKMGNVVIFDYYVY